MTEHSSETRPLISTHWGVYRTSSTDHGTPILSPFEEDGDPSLIGLGLAAAADDAVRIRQPMVRAGYLEGGPASRASRGAEPFVPVDWERAFDLVAHQLKTVIGESGNEAIFAGSYGWASAGRFHHAQSQLRRFLNFIGGFVRSVQTYSYAAGEVILPHVIGDQRGLTGGHTHWSAIAQHSRLVVMFGGAPLRNTQVNAGGTGQHTARAWLEKCRAAGVSFVNVSPARDSAPEFLDADWLAVRPGSDTALMLGLAHTLVSEDLHDQAFLDRYCVGFERFLPYLTGAADDQAKDADWAATLCDLSAEAIRTLARRMAQQRTMISVSWSLQRGDHGEQPYWMAVTLAALLGQIGLPGGGFGFGYGSAQRIGHPSMTFPWPALPQGRNPVAAFIPVARISDMLLNPGQRFEFNGQSLRYPDIRLIYWAGGNPFHHHQDLNRLVAAWRRPETVVVHEIWWNALARHADIVLPATTAMERNDIGCGNGDGFLVAMRQAMAPVGEARNDHDIFRGLARRLGVLEAFTEGRGEMDWLRHFYDLARQRPTDAAVDWPDFETFWETGWLELPEPEQPTILLSEFRGDPSKFPLKTPSGRIEISSETIASFGYEDCPGHPCWMEPAEWLAAPAAKRFPLHLISTQPATRLHSQLDNAPLSQSAKVAGREPITLNPDDARARGIADGDVVRVFNDRGACLAGARISADLRPGVAELSTGAWYDPLEPGRIGSLDVHGNPNVLTLDKGTSKLAQAPSAQSALVEVEAYRGEVPPVTSFRPPPVKSSKSGSA